MSMHPRFQVYAPSAMARRRATMVASCRDAETAAWVASMGVGFVVKCLGRKVWHEGQEEALAADSFEAAAEVMRERVREIHRQGYIKAHGALPA